MQWTCLVLITVRHVRKRGDLKSPVREYCTPGSVRGAPGNRCPYLDRLNAEGGAED